MPPYRYAYPSRVAAERRPRPARYPAGSRRPSEHVAPRIALQYWRPERGIYPGPVLELSSLDLEEIANALADQSGYEHRWLISPQTGEIVLWTADTGIDGKTPVDLDELDQVGIDPLPSWIWYQDMADFAEQITDERAGRRLARAIQGKGPSAGSRTSSTASIRTCYRRGTSSAMPVPGVVPSGGWPTTRSSTARRPTASWPATQIQTSPEPADPPGSHT